MPKKLHKCVNKLKAKGYKESSAWAICNASLKKKTTKKRRRK